MDSKLMLALKTEALRLAQGNLLGAKDILNWLMEDTYAALVKAAKEEATAKDTVSVQSNH